MPLTRPRNDSWCEVRHPHQLFDGYQPWGGTIRSRSTGALVADRPGTAVA
jgi:hypothetical protein